MQVHCGRKGTQTDCFEKFLVKEDLHRGANYLPGDTVVAPPDGVSTPSRRRQTANSGWSSQMLCMPSTSSLESVNKSLPPYYLAPPQAQPMPLPITLAPTMMKLYYLNYSAPPPPPS